MEPAFPTAQEFDGYFFSTGGAGTGITWVTGASCQWPCSTDHTFPGGTSPGGCGAGVYCGEGGGDMVMTGAEEVPPTAGMADDWSTSFGLVKK